MEGDPRNPRLPLLKKYDIPVDHLSYEYVEKCTDKKELERIIRILRSGEEGSYPDLQKVAEDRLRIFAPDSRILRVETAILTKDSLSNDEWSAVETDLLSWEEEMKIMDKSLNFEKNRFIESAGNKNLPNIRKIMQQPLKTEISNKRNEKKSDAVRIKSGDYAAWDKFDVDKELLKVDIEEERKKEENEKKLREVKKEIRCNKTEIFYPDKASYSSMEQQVLSNQAKDRGNECYKSGDLESALKYYNISIKLYASANAFNNRAMTYLKLKQYEQAIKDCNKVLDMEQNNVKALLRRATAYQCLPDGSKNDELAYQDLNKIVLLEPNNKVAQSDLQKLKKKLHIEDVGKKFRMPIYESGNVEVVNVEGKKSFRNNNDDSVAVEKLPLTYYGPSTSTFQCEPFSMTHRLLAGSALLGRVACKCNSNRFHQNPLCQKCGEKMCSPKPPLKMISDKLKVENKFNIKKDSEAKNQVQQGQLRKTERTEKCEQVESSNEPKVDVDVRMCNPEKAFGDKNNRNNEINNKLTNRSDIGKLKSRTLDDGEDPIQLKQEVPYLNVRENECQIIENVRQNKLESNAGKKIDKISTIVKVDDGPTSNYTDEPTEFNNDGSLGSEFLKSVTLENNVAAGGTEILKNDFIELENFKNKSNEVKHADITSQNDVKRTWSNSKNRKKRSKEFKESNNRKHMEPVKIVHAAKYLHPTSVEPKLTAKTSKEPREEINFSKNCQFKAFVPNKRCSSAESVGSESFSKCRLPLVDGKSSENFQSDNCNRVENVSSNASLEGNKENILENSSFTGNVEIENVEKESKKEMVVESAFEFVKTWEELKKVDESYAKRAEIIRVIKPKDLGKVFGIKLDSDMLSCFLECLQRHFVKTEPKVVIELLKQLPEVPRFGLVKMFLADRDRQTMKNLIEVAEEKGFTLAEDIKNALVESS